jgi:hypothetical protein
MMTRSLKIALRAACIAGLAATVSCDAPSDAAHTSSSTAAVTQSIVVHSCTQEGNGAPVKHMTAETSDLYGMPKPNSSEWLYGANEPGLPYSHYVIGVAKSRCTASYNDDMSTRIITEDPATNGTIEDYFDTSIDLNAQEDLCNAFPELQDPKYGISETRGGLNGCVPQSAAGIYRIKTNSSVGNLWVGMQENGPSTGTTLEENSIGTEKYVTWNLVIAHVNNPGGGLNASADFRILVCAEPSAALNVCLTSFDYFLREAVTEDKIDDISLDDTISNIEQYVRNGS